MSPTPWTTERKIAAALRAEVVGRELWRADSRLIERPGWRQLVTPSAIGFLNEISCTDVAPEHAERVIDEAISVYRAHGLATKWYVDPSTRPADLGERLVRRGFESSDVRAMGIATDHPLAAESGIDVAPVGEAELDGYLEAMMTGWSIDAGEQPAERASHLRELSKRPPTASFFVARLGGANVGSAALFLRDGYGYLVGGHVLEHARGRGAYRALVAARLAFSRARGDAYAVTLAREATAAPLLEHLGFETLYRCQCYVLPFAPAYPR